MTYALMFGQQGSVLPTIITTAGTYYILKDIPDLENNSTYSYFDIEREEYIYLNTDDWFCQDDGKGHQNSTFQYTSGSQWCIAEGLGRATSSMGVVSSIPELALEAGDQTS